MGSCIICGTSVDGRICSSHEEDVVFEFRGDHPNQLSTDRYYRGTVDGFAEFGVFVDIGDRVTGLLHRSELDRRLDSLDWDPGDVVYVKVQNVRDNGNVDLAWSIRQSEREFRGTLVDDPSLDHEKLKSEVDGEESADTDERADAEEPADAAEADSGNAQRGSGSNGRSGAAAEAGDDADVATPTVTTPDTDGGSDSDREASGTGREESVGSSEESDTGRAETDVSSGGAAVVTEQAEPTEVSIGELAENEGEDVRIEGVVADIQQTSGPTVFTIRDEEGSIECAAFVEAGVRAYPEAEEDDVVRLDGEVRERRGELQVETEALVVLDEEAREAVERRMADALEAQARPDAVEPLADDPAVDALADELRDAATAIRKAVFTDRPVIVRHAATADGYVAGVALERATLPLVQEAHRAADAVYHYFDRRPLEGGVYDMDDATKDTTGMLENRERHDEKLPLFVFVAGGGTSESMDGFELLDLYGAPRVVVDDADADETVVDAVDTVVSPALTDVDASTTAAALTANIAAHVNENVRADLAHLPAVSFWDDAPAAYVDLAAEAGYDADAVRDLREAVALEAFYQSYEDKRELVTDLLFGDDEDDVSALASNVAEQFREKLTEEVDTAVANLEMHTAGDADVGVLDADAFTHRYDFPPASLLLDELARQLDDVDAIVGINTDALYLRGDDGDLQETAAAIAEGAPDAAVTVRSTREKRLRFLSGERDAVLEATLDVLAD